MARVTLPLRDSDIAAWRKLMARVRVALTVRQADDATLIAAASRARTARMPFPPYARTNIFCQLQAAAEKLDGTRDGWSRLEAVYDACLAIWPDVFDRYSRPRGPVTHVPEQPNWMRRRDLFDE